MATIRTPAIQRAFNYTLAELAVFADTGNHTPEQREQGRDLLSDGLAEMLHNDRTEEEIVGSLLMSARVLIDGTAMIQKVRAGLS